MSVPEVRSVRRGPTEGESVWLLGGLYRYRAVGDETADVYSLFEVRGPAGLASPVHVHDHEAEAFYVVDGQVTIFIGDEQIEGTPGSFALVPANVAHTFRLDSAEAKLLLLITPGNAGHEGLFREMGQPADSLQPPTPSMPDFAELGAIAARHGTTIVGPPPAPKDEGRS